MLFNSYEFLLFLPIVFILYHIIPVKFRHIWLLLASYYFYMCWNPKYLVLLLISTVATYVSGLLIGKKTRKNAKQKKKKIVLAICIILNLLILFFFKYFNFSILVIENILRAIHISTEMKQFDIVLPVGISFYTFQALGYIIDVYRGDVKAEKNFFKYALFVSFFPQLVAGPIERTGNLLKQIKEPVKLTYNSFKEGVYLLVWGYFIKLVIADRAGIFVDSIYNSDGEYAGLYYLVATMIFSIQIYCDFYGYSVIAKGCGKLMGVELMENFNAPYFASSIADFWRRWHISLSTWFRDYLYIPLGGNRKGLTRQCINLLIVFLASGLWHGAAFTFVIWGGLHGLYQIAGKVSLPIRKTISERLNIDENLFSQKLLKVVVTYLLVVLAWIFFRAESAASAFEIIKSIVTVHNPWILWDGSLFECGLSEKNVRLLLYSIMILFLADFLKNKGMVIRYELMKQSIWFRWLLLICSIVFILVFGIWGSGYDSAGFIYFQF